MVNCPVENIEVRTPMIPNRHAWIVLSEKKLKSQSKIYRLDEQNEPRGIYTNSNMSIYRRVSSGSSQILPLTKRDVLMGPRISVHFC